MLLCSPRLKSQSQNFFRAKGKQAETTGIGKHPGFTGLVLAKRSGLTMSEYRLQRERKKLSMSLASLREEIRSLSSAKLAEEAVMRTLTESLRNNLLCQITPRSRRVRIKKRRNHRVQTESVKLCPLKEVPFSNPR